MPVAAAAAPPLRPQGKSLTEARKVGSEVYQEMVAIRANAEADPDPQDAAAAAVQHPLSWQISRMESRGNGGPPRTAMAGAPQEAKVRGGGAGPAGS